LRKGEGEFEYASAVSCQFSEQVRGGSDKVMRKGERGKIATNRYALQGGSVFQVKKNTRPETTKLVDIQVSSQRKKKKKGGKGFRRKKGSGSGGAPHGFVHRDKTTGQRSSAKRVA